MTMIRIHERSPDITEYGETWWDEDGIDRVFSEED